MARYELDDNTAGADKPKTVAFNTFVFAEAEHTADLKKFFDKFNSEHSLGLDKSRAKENYTTVLEVPEGQTARAVVIDIEMIAKYRDFEGIRKFVGQLLDWHNQTLDLTQGDKSLPKIILVETEGASKVFGLGDKTEAKLKAAFESPYTKFFKDQVKRIFPRTFSASGGNVKEQSELSSVLSEAMGEKIHTSDFDLAPNGKSSAPFVAVTIHALDLQLTQVFAIANDKGTQNEITTIDDNGEVVLRHHIKPVYDDPALRPTEKNIKAWVAEHRITKDKGGDMETRLIQKREDWKNANRIGNAAKDNNTGGKKVSGKPPQPPQ